MALLAAGCGGSGKSGGHEKAAARSQRPLRVAALGDSITAGNPGFDPDPRARRAYAFGHDPRSQYEYWASRDDPRLRFRNCGVFGETTAQIAQGLRSCARGADALVIEGGINDIAQSLAEPGPFRLSAVARAGATIGQMIEQGRQLGLRVVVADVLPWNRGYPTAAPLIRHLNGIIAATARVEQVPLLRFNEALAARRNPNLMQHSLTADGDHPSIAGYRRLGAVVASALR